MGKSIAKSAIIVILAVLLMGAAIFFAPKRPFNSISVAEKVIGSAVRIEVTRLDDPMLGGSGSGTIIALKNINGQKYAIILTAAHIIDGLALYEIGYTKTTDGKFMDYSVLEKVSIEHVNRELDLALISVAYTNEDINEELIFGKIYSGTDDIFNKDILVTSYPKGFGPVFSRGYINALLIMDDKETIGVYGIIDYGSSGSAIRDATTGEILGVVSRILGVNPNHRVLCVMSCVKYTEINKFLKESSVVLD